MPITPENLERVGPRLRMVCNGDEEVNALRAQLSAAVATTDQVAAKYHAAEKLQQASAPDELGQALPKPPKLTDRSPKRNGVKLSCFVQLATPDESGRDFPGSKAKRGDLVTAELSPEEIEAVTNGQAGATIAYIELGETLSLPMPRVTPAHVSAPQSRAPALGPRAKAKDTARPPLANGEAPAVIIGIIDVGGFDFAHPDFIDRRSGASRFVAIWDQAAEPGGILGDAPAPFDYGAELTHDRMKKALAWSKKKGVGIAATDLVRQTVQQAGSHATHVASIAAGNRGVCPFAAIAGVSIALTESERDRRATLYDSARLAHAVDYLFGLGQRLYGKPIPTVINISLGTNGQAHDGTSHICRWIDSALMTAGRCVCVAAGNSGQEAPQFAGDLGYLGGRIHASGRVPARGLETDLEWHVVGNGIADVSENELEIWYEPGDELEVRLRTPSGLWIGPVAPGRYVENMRLRSETFVSIFNERYLPGNGANRISIFLSPRLKGKVVRIQPGAWLVRLRGLEIRDGRFDAWIERDDPKPLGRIGEVDAWRFPSYFTSRSNVDRSSVSSLACGHRVISVGNGEEMAERIHRSSSQGPTRDGRQKPEITAYGTDVTGARGFASPDQPWLAMTGTSMASPRVAGVAAQMLARQPRLTALQIAGIMRKTARPLPGADYRWQDAAGFGLIDPTACLEEVDLPFEPVDLKPEDPRARSRS